MAAHHHGEIGIVLVKLTVLHAVSYFFANYDKILGAVLTGLSIIYVGLKIWNEYIKPKKKNAGN